MPRTKRSGFNIVKRKKDRRGEVRASPGELVCADGRTVYKRGTVEVVRRLAA